MAPTIWCLHSGPLSGLGLNECHPGVWGPNNQAVGFYRVDKAEARVHRVYKVQARARGLQFRKKARLWDLKEPLISAPKLGIPNPQSFRLGFNS